MATREASGKTLNALAGIIPNLIGGSADLDPSTSTAVKGEGDFESPLPGVGGDGDLRPQGAAGGVWVHAEPNMHVAVSERATGPISAGRGLHRRGLGRRAGAPELPRRPRPHAPEAPRPRPPPRTGGRGGAGRVRAGRARQFAGGRLAARGPPDRHGIRSLRGARGPRAAG